MNSKEENFNNLKKEILSTTMDNKKVAPYVFKFTHHNVKDGRFPREEIEKLGIDVEVIQCGYTKELVTLTFVEGIEEFEKDELLYQLGVLVSNIRHTKIIERL